MIVRCQHLCSTLVSCARRVRDDDRGGTAVFLLGGMIVLLVLGTTAMFVLGDAVADRRRANAAADSASLAAASYCGDRLVEAYQQGVSGADGWSFWAPFGKPVSMYCAGSALEAANYASQNGSVLTSMTPNFVALRFKAGVRENTGVDRTTAHETSVVAAKLTPKQGLCVSGGLLGIQAEGRCQLFPTKFKPKTNEPLRPIGYSPIARVSTRLVRP